MNDGTSDVIVVNGSNETTATIQNLILFSSYTLYVTAFTETGCVTGPTSVDIMVMESECCCCCYLLFSFGLVFLSH